ncbi:potassium transporter TrkG [Oceaniglobus ichthyenteri]|uniref:potassium transporter TrkG n=1 Tax=Oceaniglobus ichthyenteri TaxID=2136177 RepID=UPI0019816CF2|nr:potassium transporter TrkG [Oceaniglobus ichthyenteri]
MERVLVRFPLIVVLMGIAAVGMIVPSIHAYVMRDLHVARVFFYASLVFCILTALIAIATDGMILRRQARGYLIALVAAFTVIPAVLAVPFYEALGTTRFSSAWFEMVSSMTTTGATLYDPARLPDSLHLWRAMVGWFGGLLVWVTAVALIAPMNLGGFEVLSDGGIGEGASPAASQITRVADGSERLARFAGSLAPIYVSLTLVLWIGLAMAGETPLAAICRAMSTMATSGITTGQGGQGGFFAEFLIFLFLFFAISRLTFSSDSSGRTWEQLRRDPEFQMGVFCITALPLLLFARHWIGAYEIDGAMSVERAARALWGAVFTTLSFLTTTGFVSADWDAARNWSGLETPGILLMGLALIGGGVATTAGGVKLLRIYALYKHGVREMEKLVHPTSVGGAGTAARRMRRKGAYVAWVFFMLFAVSVAVMMLAFALTGIKFEQATVLTIAALSTTGPLVTLGAGDPIAMATLTGTAKTIFAFAMVLGRLETLALIALLNPDFWRH